MKGVLKMKPAGQKTRKVLDINIDGYNFICIFAVHQKRNPYRLCLRWYEDGGWHRKTLETYQNFISVIYHLKFFMEDKHIGFTDVFD